MPSHITGRLVLTIYWAYFLASKIIAVILGDWFVANIDYVLPLFCEFIFIIMLVCSKKTAFISYFSSIMFLSGAIVYHYKLLILQPGQSCGCMGLLPVTHFAMIPVAIAGIIIAIWATLTHRNNDVVLS